MGNGKDWLDFLLKEMNQESRIKYILPLFQPNSTRHTTFTIHNEAKFLPKSSTRNIIILCHLKREYPEIFIKKIRYKIIELEEGAQVRVFSINCPENSYTYFELDNLGHV